MRESKIILNNISKKFDLGYDKNEGVLFRILSLMKINNKKKEIFALDNINLKIPAGANLGVIGLNGSGKSTLLRVMAGIYEPDQGLIKIDGKLIYLSGLGQGLKPKLTVRENIFLTGAILGLSRNDVVRIFDLIINFAELDSYTDVNVGKLSSGMVTRLNFSVMVYCLSCQDPDILLLDEVFGGGGDIGFKKKSLDKIEEVISGKVTTVFVSHEMSYIKKYCNQVIWLDKGKIVRYGNVEEIIESYKNSIV